MNVHLQFTRASQETEGLGLGGDRDVFAYDLDVPGQLTLIAECHHDAACGTAITQGQVLPSRPCPLKVMGDVPQWMCVAIHDCRWRGDNPLAQTEKPVVVCPRCKKRPAVQTPDNERFAQIRVDDCVSCPHAGNAVIGLEEDRAKVVEAFKQALANDADLSPEDRELGRWEILWQTTTVS